MRDQTFEAEAEAQRPAAGQHDDRNPGRAVFGALAEYPRAANRPAPWPAAARVAHHQRVEHAERAHHAAEYQRDAEAARDQRAADQAAHQTGDVRPRSRFEGDGRELRRATSRQTEPHT